MARPFLQDAALNVFSFQDFSLWELSECLHQDCEFGILNAKFSYFDFCLSFGTPRILSWRISNFGESLGFFQNV